MYSMLQSSRQNREIFHVCAFEDSKLLQGKFFPEWSVDSTHPIEALAINLRRNEQASPKIWMEMQRKQEQPKFWKIRTRLEELPFLISKHNQKLQLSKGIVLAK